MVNIKQRNDYYSKKMLAQKTIKEMIKRGVYAKEDIIIFIMENYGFGELFVNKYLNLLYELQFIRYEHGLIKEKKENDGVQNVSEKKD